MKSIIEQLSKEIVAAAEGETAGIVTNVFVDDKLTRVRGYKASDDESDEAKLLPLRRLIGDGDALIVCNLSVLKEGGARECPLGAKIYDTCGKLHGILRDLTFDEVSGKVVTLIADQCEIEAGRVLSFGKRAIVLRSPEHERSLFRKRTSAPKRAPRELAVREDLPSPVQAVDAELPETAEQKNAQTEGDFRFREYAFLLGRKLRKDIVSGEVLIASKEEVVTPEVILRAHRNGKLVELTVNSSK